MSQPAPPPTEVYVHTYTSSPLFGLGALLFGCQVTRTVVVARRRVRRRRP
ncbi:MAG: hypothetical protein KC636_30485 [Myxococcales bacterium]|nr:hypothetical protein [Myxococcales bacterium]